MKKVLCVAAVLALLCIGTAAVASNVYDLSGSYGWVPLDVRSGGSASISADQPRDGNASLKITTTDVNGLGNAKAGILGGTGSSLGTLGALADGSLSFDFLRAIGSTTDVWQTINFKLDVMNTNGQTGLLVWEWVYNHGNGAVTEGAWYDDYSLIDQKFWVRSASHNFDQIANMKTLGDWAAGASVVDGSLTSIALGADTQVLAAELGLGSWVYGDFVGYADDVQMSFANGGSYGYNFEAQPAVPEPMSVMLGIMGLGSVAGLRRLRRK